MPTPGELFLSDPFVQELKAISKIVNQLTEIYLNKDVPVTLPFTNAPVSAAFSANQAGVDALQAAINQGTTDLQTRVSSLVVPVLSVKPPVVGPGLEGV